MAKRRGGSLMAHPGNLAQQAQPDQNLYDMMDEILVVCPRCKSCAQITLVEPGSRDWFAPRRLVCSHCAYTREWAEKEIHRGWYDRRVVDDFFGEPLWLQEPCDGNVLWVYNLRHLNLIEGYVRAKLREHPARTLFNRLPRWVDAAKNRAVVLKALQRLRAKYLA
jgi:hypothetical protein